MPNHVGIPGNGLTDVMAKAASFFLPTETRLPYTDYFPTTYRQLRTAWPDAWERLDVHNGF